MKLDLDRHRDVGAIVNDAFRLFFAHSHIFFTATLVLVAPVTIVVDGVWGRQLAEGASGGGPDAAAVVSALLLAFVVPPMVTAIHVTAVQALGRGEEPELDAVMRHAARNYAPLLVVTLLFTAVVFFGLILLIIPGLWLSIRLFFGAQIAMVDGLRGADALRASSALVKGHWWRVFGIQLLLTVIGAFAAGAVAAIADEAGSGALYVIVATLAQTFAISIVALGATLLFFDLRRPVQAVRGFDPPVAA